VTGQTQINIEDTVGEKTPDTDVPQNRSLFKKLLTLKMIIIYCIVFVLAGASFFAWWFFFLKGSDKISLDKAKQAAQTVQAEKNGDKKNKPQFKNIVELAPFVKIKLKPSGNFSLITMSIALQLADNNMRQTIEADKSIIRKIITHETEKMTWFVLRNPEGKLKLKYNLIKTINSALSKSSNAKINNLYFTNFIMQ